MRYILFSRFGIHHESPESGAAYGVYVPSQENIKNFGDVEHNTGAIKERMGEGSKIPLWREDRNAVSVYGTLLDQLKERRHKLSVYLPQDFVSDECEIFYFVFGNRWIIHGVKGRTEEGYIRWGISRHDTQDKDLVQLLVKMVSEQLLDSEEGRVVVAVLENDQVFESLKSALQPFDLEVAPFTALKPSKEVEPLYRHRDNSLLMFTLGFFALLLLISVTAYWLNSLFKLNETEKKVSAVRTEIRSIKVNEQLGHIRQPEEILKLMEKPMRQKPSAIFHGAGQIGKQFGTLKEIVLNTKDIEGQRGQDQKIKVKIILDTFEDKLLVDQESLAQELIEEYAWIRKIERNTGQNVLEAVLQIDMRGTK